MRRLVGFFGIGLLLVSCATLPAPQGPESSLVVGNMVIDFPDGFFDLAPTTLDQHVELTFRDVSDNKNITVYTANGGFYYFLADPGKTYRLESCSAKVSGAHGTYSTGHLRLNWAFTVEPRKLVYLGHYFIIFRAPKVVEAHGNRSNWDYDIHSQFLLKPDSMRQFISDTQADSPWVSYELVRAKISREK